MCFKKTQLILLFILLCSFGRVFGQNYEYQSFRIDSLTAVGLPKSALAETDLLDKMARENHNAPMQIKAAIYRMRFQSYIEENSLIAIIDRLKADIAQAQYPVKPVLQSILANMYYQYYQQNRWSYAQRTQLEKPGDDYTKWDLKTIIDETSRQYQLSLQDPAQLQKTPIGVLDGVLTGDKTTRYLRPTLYDLLVQRTFDFFLLDEPALTKPRQPFSINDPRFFGDGRTFASLHVATTDTASTWYKGLMYLQQATLFHLQNGDDEALADLDIKRLGFLHEKATFDGRDSLYLQTLKNIASVYQAKPVSAQALALVGQYYQQQNNMVTALPYLEKAVALFPNSVGGKNAASAIVQIKDRTLTASTEHYYYPDKPILAMVAYRNIKAAGVTIYKLPADKEPAIQYFQRNYYNYKFKADTVFKFLAKLKRVGGQELQLPSPQDYHQHSVEFKIDALPAGRYVILVKDAQAAADTSMMQLGTFTVSRLSYVTRVNADGKLQVNVMDREPGKPLPGVKVSVGTADDFGVVLRADNGVSNNDGAVVFQKFQPGNYGIRVGMQLVFGRDTLNDPAVYASGATVADNTDDKVKTGISVMTDREIYRPGQTVYFKLLELSLVNGKTSVIPFKEDSVSVNDANGKEITTLKFKTNQFGSYGGSFVLPQNILDGEITFEDKSENDRRIETHIRVEEYKRPTFNVEISKIKENYRLNDTVKVKGTVKAFSGFGLSQARVAWHVTRTQGYMPYDPRHPVRYNFYSTQAIIKTDTIVTDDQGNFTLSFKAAPGEVTDVNYNYAITADVTDGSGETHSAEATVVVGINDIKIDGYVPTAILATDTVRLALRNTNLNGQLQAGNIKIQVDALQSPGVLYKKRLWTVPDQYLLSSADYQNYFPDYAYRGADDFNHYPVINRVEDTGAPTVADKPTFITLNNLNKQPAGMYRVTISAANMRGDTTSMVRYINLIKEPAMPQTVAGWLQPVRTRVQHGGKAAFLVGADKDSYVLMEQYQGAKLLSAEWLYISKGQQRIEIPAAANDSIINVQFLMVHKNRIYDSYLPITVLTPANRLNLKLLTYRDKLQPGDKETWKLKVSGSDTAKVAAEVLASMYDASLDDISQPQGWNPRPDRVHDFSMYRQYYNWQVYSFNTLINTSPVKAKPYIGYYNYSAADYEHLNMFGYAYFGAYNYGYRQYLNVVNNRIAMDKRLEDNYKKNAAMVKDGYDITGQVTDAKSKTAIHGVSVTIQGTSITTTTNALGTYKIKVPFKGVLVFRFVGYKPFTLQTQKAGTVNVVLTTDGSTLKEVAITGNRNVANGTGLNISTRDLTTASATIQAKDLEELSATSIDQALQGRMPGGDIVASSGDPGAVKQVRLNGKDFMDTVQYRASDYSVQVNHNRLPIATRKNFAETAFFYPQLHTDEKGEVLISFTMPESLTKWTFRALAHTTDFKLGYLKQDVVTQKQLSISANTPRFLREGDTITISARLSNLTTEPLKGIVSLQLFNAVNMQPVSLLLNATDAQQTFNIGGNINKAVSFKMYIPAGLDALTYKLTADAGTFSDGEENTLPVLPNSTLVTESMPMMVRPGQSRTYTFDKLINQTSTTLQNKSLTLEYTANPAWYAVQALPYMMEFPYECSEQIFSRYYANSLAGNLVNHLPRIKQVFDQWKAAASPELLSNLEKNQELKATLIEETPWLRDAQSETEQKKRIALLFDLDKMSAELKLNLDKLKNRQLPDGSFPWFGGDRGDRYITQHILAGVGQLYHLGIGFKDNDELKDIAFKAMGYVQQQLINDAVELKKRDLYATRRLGATEVHSYYAQSYYAEKYFANSGMSKQMQAMLSNYLNLASRQWVGMNVYEQAMVALTMQRYKRPDIAKAIIKSLLETAHQSDDMGMYWSKNQLGYFWYQSPIETQSLMIELFTDAGNQDKAVSEIKIWLLRNKQANNWKTTKATAAACYALLLRGDDWLAETTPAEIRLAGEPLTALKPDVKADEGTGYLKTTWTGNDVKPALGKVEIKNPGKTINWGALHWQYLEQLDKITPSKTDIKLERKYFILKHTDAGDVLTAIDAAHKPKVGDLLKVVVYLNAGRDFEYIQLKDMRPAGTEPVDALSHYNYQDGLCYYQVTKDVATNFFISYLNKGNYVFEYRLRVAQPGNFATGITTVQSMYAPEFNAHSEGARMEINH